MPVFWYTVCVCCVSIDIPIECLFVECVRPSSALVVAMEFTQEGLQTRNGVYPWFGVSCFVPFLSVPSEVGHPEEFGA